MNKPVILLVEDDKEVRTVLADFMRRRYDCDFKEAKDGDEAVKFVKENHCDLMILDIKLPKKSGVEVLKESKAMKPDIDVMIVSGWVSDDVADLTINGGATDYVLKPIDLKVICMKFEKILAARGQKFNKIISQGK